MRLLIGAIAVAVVTTYAGPVTQTEPEPDCSSPITITAPPKEVAEAVPMDFTVTKAADCHDVTSVTYKTVQIPKPTFVTTEGVDYPAAAGSKTWAPNDLSEKTISIVTWNDYIVEPIEDLEVCVYYSIEGQPGSRCAIGRLSTPLCDRPQPPAETCGCMFHVDLPEPARLPVWLTFTTRDGTALAGEDYVGTSGRVQIPAGATSATFGVDILPNSGHDPEEWFMLEIEANWGDHVESRRQQVTIQP